MAVSSSHCLSRCVDSTQQSANFSHTCTRVRTHTGAHPGKGDLRKEAIAAGRAPEHSNDADSFPLCVARLLDSHRDLHHRHGSAVPHAFPKNDLNIRMADIILYLFI